MKYVFIDTNIYVYCALSSTGHDPQLITTLWNALKHWPAVLLLPEVVNLELKRQLPEQGEVLKERAKRAKGELKKVNFPPEVGQDMEQHLEKLTNARLRSLEDAEERIREVYSSSQAEVLPLTSEVMLAAYKRALSGRKPYRPRKGCENRPDSQSSKDVLIKGPINLLDADSMIIETLIQRLEDSSSSDHLVICSHNLRDFGQWDDSARQHVIDPQIKNDFKVAITYYTSLLDMIKKEFSIELGRQEAERYAAAVSYLAPQLHEPTAPGIGLYLEVLAAKIDQATLMVLHWLGIQDEAIGEDVLDDVFLNSFVPGKLDQILEDLRAYYLADVYSDKYSVTDLGRRFLDYVGWKRTRQNWRPYGDVGL